MTKVYCDAIKSSVELINQIDAEHEEHFIFLVERLEDDIRDKNSGAQPSHILCLL